MDTRSREASIGMRDVVVSGDMVKLLWFDGDGLCLFSKRLERGRFVWPQATSATVSLSRAQLSMLLEGIYWRASLRTAERVMSV